MKRILTILFSAAALSCVTALPPPVPVISSATNTTFTVGVPGSFIFTATNPPINNWQASGGSWPASVTLDPATGKLSGTPLLAEVGTYTRSITVANGGGTSLAKVFTLTVRDVPRIVILKEASPIAQKKYSYTHDALVPDEIAADSTPSSGSFAGTYTAYYILDMVARQFARVVYETTPASGSSPAQKTYSVDAATPFTDGFIDTMLPSRTANSLDVVFGKTNVDLSGGPDNPSEDMTSYNGLASPLAVTTATATVPAWMIPYAVKNLSGKRFDYGRQILPTANPNVTIHQFSFATTTITVNLDTVLTPQGNTGGLLPKIDPATGLPKVPAQNWDGILSNSMAYGVQLVKNTLEKLKYVESP